jgi:2-oxoglutarate dehydrogenase E1 component
MQPKSMLRLPAAASRLEDLASGRFQAVIDDPAMSARREEVTRLVVCTGKLYYELADALRRSIESGQRPEGAPTVALVRVEELFPWPMEEVARIVDAYPATEEIVWAQEEPKNMGAWSYVAPRLRASAGNAMIIRYIGRPERASPAEGYLLGHNEEQRRIIGEVLDSPLVMPRRRARATTG